MDTARRQFLRSAALSLVAACLHGAAAEAAGRAQGAESWYPLRGDDGKPVPNTRLPVEVAGDIDELPGTIWLGAKSTAVTLYEFYDYNCPYCRVAARDLPKLLQRMPDLRVGLINNAILSLGSVQAAKVELALLTLKGPKAAYQFHQRLFAAKGANDGPRALAAAEGLGVPRAQIEAAADSERIRAMLVQQTKLAANLGLVATPSFVAGGVGILGYPGPKALAGIASALDRCGEVVCTG